MPNDIPEFGHVLEQDAVATYYEKTVRDFLSHLSDDDIEGFKKRDDFVAVINHIEQKCVDLTEAPYKLTLTQLYVLVFIHNVDVSQLEQLELLLEPVKDALQAGISLSSIFDSALQMPNVFQSLKDSLTTLKNNKNTVEDILGKRLDKEYVGRILLLPDGVNKLIRFIDDINVLLNNNFEISHFNRLLSNNKNVIETIEATNYIRSQYFALIGRELQNMPRDDSKLNLTPAEICKILKGQSKLLKKTLEYLVENYSHLYGDIGLNRQQFIVLASSENAIGKFETLTDHFTFLQSKLGLVNAVNVLTYPGGNKTIQYIVQNYDLFTGIDEPSLGLSLDELVKAASVANSSNNLECLSKHFSTLITLGFNKAQIIDIASCRSGGKTLNYIVANFNSPLLKASQNNDESNNDQQVTLGGFFSQDEIWDVSAVNLGWENLEKIRTAYFAVSDIFEKKAPNFKQSFLGVIRCEQGAKNIDGLLSGYEKLLAFYSHAVIMRIASERYGFKRIELAVEELPNYLNAPGEESREERLRRFFIAITRKDFSSDILKGFNPVTNKLEKLSEENFGSGARKNRDAVEQYKYLSGESSNNTHKNKDDSLSENVSNNVNEVLPLSNHSDTRVSENASNNAGLLNQHETNNQVADYESINKQKIQEVIDALVDGLKNKLHEIYIDKNIGFHVDGIYFRKKGKFLQLNLEIKSSTNYDSTESSLGYISATVHNFLMSRSIKGMVEFAGIEACVIQGGTDNVIANLVRRVQFVNNDLQEINHMVESNTEYAVNDDAQPSSNKATLDSKSGSNKDSDENASQIINNNAVFFSVSNLNNSSHKTNHQTGDYNDHDESSYNSNKTGHELNNPDWRRRDRGSEEDDVNSFDANQKQSSKKNKHAQKNTSNDRDMPLNTDSAVSDDKAHQSNLKGKGSSIMFRVTSTNSASRMQKQLTVDNEKQQSDSRSGNQMS